MACYEIRKYGGYDPKEALGINLDILRSHEMIRRCLEGGAV